MVSPRFFPRLAKLRAWLHENHASASELWVGFYKQDSGKPSMTWPESVDAALSYGWIDGLRKSIDDVSYVIRFTPRKPTSIWSNVNIAKVNRLIEQGRMAPAGLAAWDLRDEQRSGVYAFERKATTLDMEATRLFKRNETAWSFFQAQPPYYRRVAAHYVSSAKREETRERRLAALIEHSAKGQRIPQFASPRVELRDGLSLELDFLRGSQIGEHWIRRVPHHDASCMRSRLLDRFNRALELRNWRLSGAHAVEHIRHRHRCRHSGEHLVQRADDDNRVIAFGERGGVVAQHCVDLLNRHHAFAAWHNVDRAVAAQMRATNDLRPVRQAFRDTAEAHARTDSQRRGYGRRRAVSIDEQRLARLVGGDCGKVDRDDS